MGRFSWGFLNEQIGFAQPLAGGTESDSELTADCAEALAFGSHPNQHVGVYVTTRST